MDELQMAARQNLAAKLEQSAWAITGQAPDIHQSADAPGLTRINLTSQIRDNAKQTKRPPHN
jgi:hypothetical protein